LFLKLLQLSSETHFCGVAPLRELFSLATTRRRNGFGNEQLLTDKLYISWCGELATDIFLVTMQRCYV